MDHADISEWQFSVDLNAYENAGYQRLAHRATYGDGWADPRFAERWPQMLPLIRQAYHFAYPGSGAVAGQHFMQVVNAAGGLGANDEVMLDLEWFTDSNGNYQGLPPAQALQYAQDFFAQIPAGHRKFIYGNTWYIEEAGFSAADFPDVGVITASYGSSYQVPRGFDHSCFWQFTDAAPFPGLGNVDGNHLTCPNNLAHLGVEDELTPDDWTKLEALVRQAVSDGVKAELTFLQGTRTTPVGAPSKQPTTLAALADAAYITYHGIEGDAAHPGLTDAVAGVRDTQSRIASIQAGTVDPAAVRAALSGLKVEGTISE